MGITENELVYNIESSLAGQGLISDDIGVSEELIYFRLLTNRAFLIRQDQEKGRSLSDNIVQTFCVPIEQISLSQCPCKVDSSCTIFRSITPVPKFLELYQKDLIVDVHGLEITEPTWSIIPYARAKRAGISKWTLNTPKVFLHNGYLYFINIPLVQFVSVSGVLENPRDTSVYNCSDIPCYTGDSEFPISLHMVPLLTQLTLRDFGYMQAVQVDDKGDEKNEKGQTQGTSSK